MKFEQLSALIFYIFLILFTLPQSSLCILIYYFLYFIINKFVKFEMGGIESQNQRSVTDLLADYTELRKEGNGVVLADKKSENTFYLKQFSYANKKQYQNEFKRLQSVETQPQNENVLPLVRLFSQTFNNICSNSYKIYALYEYPTITLEEEISARKKQEKYFDECELWSILQSCANALSQVKPTLSLHPKNVFIVPDGVLKIVNNEMIDEDYRCYLKQGVYYAPQKIQDFKRNDNENSLRKQSIFSLGMTILHAALLAPVSDCYNFQNFQFYDEKLWKYLSELAKIGSEDNQQSENQATERVRSYSSQFIQMMAMILQPNPNKRASLMEVHGLLTKVWNTQTEQQPTKNNELQQNNLEDTERNQQTENQTLRASNKMEGSITIKAENQITKENQIVQSQHKLEIENMPKNISPQNKSYVQSFNQSQRQSKASLHEVNNNRDQRVTSRPVDTYVGSQFQPYPSYPTSSLIYSSTQGIGLSINPNKQNNLYTDPKLLEMIRKDLQDINELKKSSMMNAYSSGYGHPYIPTTSYYSSYGDIGTNMFSSKSSLGYSNSNLQQVYTVNTQANYNTQRSQNMPSYPLKTQVLKIQGNTIPKTQGFSKQANNLIYVVQQYEDGRKFEGTTLNGLKEGQGKLTYPDGAYYEGVFKNDKMQGQGTLYYGPERPAYDGNWVGDQFHGFGVLYNQSPLQLNGCFNYNDFNLIEQFWVRYEGNFESDNKSGEGKLILSNGEQFHGSFDNDSINGRGVFITKQGQQISGLWQQNILVQLEG